MSRSLSAAARRGVFAQSTGEVYLTTLTITHAALAVAIRVVNDTTDLVRQGQTFVGFPFRIHLPPDVEDRIVQVQLEIDNVDRRIGTALAGITGRPKVRLEVVLAASPETVEVGPYIFGLAEIEIDAMVVRGTLTYAPLLERRIPRDSQDPLRFPGMFR